MKFSKKIANYLVEQIRKMSENELEKTSIEIYELSKSNCWWVEYRLKSVIEEIIENEVELRIDKKLAQQPVLEDYPERKVDLLHAGNG